MDIIDITQPMGTAYTRSCALSIYRHDGERSRWNGAFFNCLDSLHTGIVVVSDVVQLLFNSICNNIGLEDFS